MTSIIRTITLFDSAFTSSFKHTSSVLYSVTFERSNALEVQEKLSELEHNFSHNINTEKHVGFEIIREDIKTAKETLSSIITAYQALHETESISPKLKIYDIIRELRENESNKDVRELANDVVLKILTTDTTNQKLTKKQKIALEAEIKSKERQINILKKRGN